MFYLLQQGQSDHLVQHGARSPRQRTFRPRRRISASSSRTTIPAYQGPSTIAQFAPREVARSALLLHDVPNASDVAPVVGQAKQAGAGGSVGDARLLLSGNGTSERYSRGG